MWTYSYFVKHYFSLISDSIELQVTPKQNDQALVVATYRVSQKSPLPHHHWTFVELNINNWASGYVCMTKSRGYLMHQEMSYFPQKGGLGGYSKIVNFTPYL